MEPAERSGLKIHVCVLHNVGGAVEPMEVNEIA